MKTKIKARIAPLGIIALTAIIALSMTACDNGTTDDSPKGITYTLAQQGGVNGTADSTGILFTFAEAIDSLGVTAADITLSGGNAAKGATAAFSKLGTSGNTWQLTPITVSHAGSVTVKITKSGIDSANNTVNVFKQGEVDNTSITYTLEQRGGAASGTASTGIAFTFSAAIDSLNVAVGDINIIGAAAKGATATFAKDGTSGNTWLLSPITVTTGGNAAVNISKTGIDPDSHSVFVFSSTPTNITYDVVQDGGSADHTATSTSLLFTFSADIDALNVTVDNIELRSLVDKTPESTFVNTEGNTWRLSPIVVTGRGNASVRIDKAGIEYTDKTPAVYRAPVTYTVTQVGGSSGVVTTGLLFEFDGAINTLGVVPNDITLSGAAIKGTGATFANQPLDSNTWLLAPIRVSEDGDVTVSINKTAFIGGPVIETISKTVGVFYAPPEFVTVTFNPEGGNWSGSTDNKTETVPYNTTVSDPGDPDRENADFEGWFTSEGEPFTVGVTLVTDDITLYAHWSYSGIEVPLVNISDVGPFLSMQTNGNSAADPVILEMQIALGTIPVPMTDTNSNWAQLLTALGDAGKYVVLDLSLCTIPNTNAIGDPEYIFSGPGGSNAPFMDGKDRITGIILPASVTGLDGYAFDRCSNLTEFTFPVGLKTLGAGVFRYTGLTKVVVPEGITTLGNEAFQYCPNLEEVTLPSTLTNAGGFTFQVCPNLILVTFLSVAPPTLGQDLGGLFLGGTIFQGTHNDLVIKVPVGSAAAYTASTNTNWNVAYRNRVEE